MKSTFITISLIGVMLIGFFQFYWPAQDWIDINPVADKCPDYVIGHEKEYYVKHDGSNIEFRLKSKVNLESIFGIILMAGGLSILVVYFMEKDLQ